tara:strand:+ start:246 stop:593 length:348 start_codon:yes stop_codon:yes gene_type:complete
MAQLTGELINLDTEQIQYLIDLLNHKIECEQVNFKHGLGKYMREPKSKPTVKQFQDHNATAMWQHSLMKQLYAISQYTILETAKLSPEQFGKKGSELAFQKSVDEELCDERGRPL